MGHSGTHEDVALPGRASRSRGGSHGTLGSGVGEAGAATAGPAAGGTERDGAADARGGECGVSTDPAGGKPAGAAVRNGLRRPVT